MEGGDDPVALFLNLNLWPIYQEEEEEEEEESQESQVVNSLSQSSSETYLVGFVIVNIVGLQYYSGTISGREMVGLVREPLNQYDPNAIKVVNTRTVQVGHIERSSAAVLAPLIDSGMILVQGIVPNSSSRGTRFKIACQVHIFARAEAFASVKSAISRGGLHLISDNDAAFTLSEALIVKEQKKKNKKDVGKSVDEIFKLVDENVSKKKEMGAIEPPKDVIKSELFLHQKEALSWLVHRENSAELPPFWEVSSDGKFVNVLTNYKTDKQPEPIRGGIFADDMGLGKTLTLLSLIAFDNLGSVNVETSSEIKEEIEAWVASGSKKSNRERVSKKVANSSRKKQKIENVVLDKANFKSTTLIVCPPSVFSTWITQLEEHTVRGRLKVYLYYGERTQDASELKKYDIVLTTYSTLASEQSCLRSPMSKIEWWRVILDEAHIIKNASARQSHAVTNLNAKRRWVVTGTPIQNGSMDLFSLMAFLRFEPFSIKNYWTSLVQRPLAQGSQKGLSRLQVLMATISLRRTKDKALIGLPPKTIETCLVDLSAEERELYDEVENQAKRVVRDYISSGRVTSNYTTVLSIILRLRQICTDAALCPPDLRTSFPSLNIGDVSDNPELLKKLISVLQDGEDFDCPICISPPTDIVITCCAHIFCRSCILKTLKRSKSCCPLCRRSLSESDLFSSPAESSEMDNTGHSSSSTSSKVEALLKLLSESRDQNPAVKSVIFSQFQKMLILLEEPLKAAGYKILRLDGSMSAKRRATVIKEFGSPERDGPSILLASLRASGTGINLTAASKVYLLEPWWNPAVEEQAMDRVHRIGQKEDVKVVRIIARNTIDERVLELQEKKKQLAREAFRSRPPKDPREINIDDLRTLMSL